MKLQLMYKDEEMIFEVKKIINAGFAGRNQEKVWEHIRELEKIGVKPPSATPTFYPLVSHAITTDEEIEVISTGNTGEAEYVLLCAPDQVYVGVGNDHTDRDLEVFNIAKSKQVYPNLLSQEVWALADVESHWDELILRSWLDPAKKQLYQEGKLANLISPGDLLKQVKGLIEGDLTGTVIYSGTIATLSEELSFSEHFLVELVDEKKQRSLSCKNTFKQLNWFKGE